MKTVDVTGGDLFHLALKYLGDASQWNRIVQVNRTTAGGPPMDPFLLGITTLKIPPINPAATGGVLVY
jgi:hypothetical protein